MLKLFVVMFALTACCSLVLAGLPPRAPGLGIPDPESGALERGVYNNPYFDLHYSLPKGWKEDIAGPPPSADGYYSLIALRPVESLSGTVLIAAQDEFFISERASGPAAFLSEIRRHLDQSLTVAPAPADQRIGGRSFARLDYSGAGLHHALYATEIRCHTVIFSFTSATEATIELLASSLEQASGEPAEAERARPGSGGPWPACVRDYATADRILHRVEPELKGPRFETIPVRIVIDVNGKVKNIHVIAGPQEQRDSVRAALAQWSFKPYRVNGRLAEVETGLSFSFGQK